MESSAPTLRAVARSHPEREPDRSLLEARSRESSQFRDPEFNLPHGFRVRVWEEAMENRCLLLRNHKV